MFRWFSRPTHMPLAVDGDDFDDKSSDILAESGYPLDRHSARPWQIVTIALAVLSLLLSIYIFTHLSSTCTNTPGFLPSDLPDARRAVEYEQREYTGALIYNPQSKLVERLRDSEIEYVGYPSQELDDKWEALIKHEFVEMTEEEAKHFRPELAPNDDGRYSFEPAVYHSLHCVNMLRLELSKKLYPDAVRRPNIYDQMKDRLPPGWETEHLEHCIDQLRQVVMCHGDLTPSPLFRWPGFPLLLGRMKEHTCRRYDRIQEWMAERASKSNVTVIH